MEYTLDFKEIAVEHLGALDKKHQRMVRQAVTEQLTWQPLVQTRNRKPLRQPACFGAEWELRCGPQNRFRVLYQIEEESGVVTIVAIGIKEGDRLSFPGEEF